VRVFRTLDEVPPGKRVAAIGTFDGVHIGHQQIIGDAIAEAKERGIKSMVITFHPHPLSIIAPDKCPPILTPLNVKTDLIGDLGADELLIIPFDDEFSQLSPTVFCEMLFTTSLEAVKVIVRRKTRHGGGRRAAGHRGRQADIVDAYPQPASQR
jgi:riboflavin kinase/FMN adenylyltransferase